ncbi:MAG: hypothetical protein ISR91_00370 [Candidatus Delongbacteria bacterium]|nr:hypothetical protein [bacterium]MBL7032577.1 hypothetical protein [Candidatus Delongbacteria bacterium]
MKQLKLGLVFTLAFITTAFGIPRDYFELGVGGHYMLDQETFTSPNKVNLYRDVFKLQGDFGTGGMGNVVLGHRFSRRDLIMKLQYFVAPVTEGSDLDDELNYYVSDFLLKERVDRTERRFNFHTFTVGMRYEFNPTSQLSSFVDLGAGVVTGTYRVSMYDVEDDWIEDYRKVQSGFVFNLGYGMMYNLGTTLDFYARGDLYLGKIPDSRNSQNLKTGDGPMMHAVCFNIGIRKFFTTPF